jgi:cell filamentation protein, protein adenylyltransferase
MAELPIYPERGREAPGYALARKLERWRDAPAETWREASERMRVECAFETLGLTGAGVERGVVDRFAGEIAKRGARVEGDAFVLGQLEALESIEAAARGGRGLEVGLIRDVHRSANPPSEGEFRSKELTPQFRNTRSSRVSLIPARLQNLLDWLSGESGHSMFPAERMALWFARFLEISPFDGGNFRTAHLLVSYFALEKGYPPVSLRLADAEAIRAEVESALRFDTFPLVQRFSDALERSVSVLEQVAVAGAGGGGGGGGVGTGTGSGTGTGIDGGGGA